MTTGPALVSDATSRQNEASDPQASTWLSANAGSGKTRVLTNRVARLLLLGVDPQNVLCLTYTKAAASEMQNRLFRGLAAWSMLDDATLTIELRKIGEDGPLGPEKLSLARTLFAKAIETPGGLRLQTIHSFCAGLLRRFPLEAGISPQFKEMEAKDAERLRAEVLDNMASGPDQPTVDGIARFLTGEDKLLKLTGEIARHAAAFQQCPTETELSTLLGLQTGATREDAAKIAFCGGEDAIVDAAKDVRPDVTASYQAFIDRLSMLNVKSPDFAAFETVFDLFLYADKTSKSRNYPQSNHKGAVEAFAPFIDDLHEWMDRTAEAWNHILAIDARDRLTALYAFGGTFVRQYADRKLARGQVDFDDLITKARHLLTTPGLAQWVLFKLDGGIDHILVDEAQDTSPDQWEVIRALASEFAAGEGAMPNRVRTIFVVGDKKQSIYSFQGADPAGFDEMRQHFDTELRRIGQRVQGLQLAHSFRSSVAILRTVDATFLGDRAAGLEETLEHIPFKDAMPGRVDLWPVFEAEANDKDEADWRTPVDRPSPTRPNVKLARHIADEIKRMIACETIPVENAQTGHFFRRPVTAGDVLILVQRRSDLFSEIIRACKAAGLPIAGADRLRLGGELAVRDLAALLQFLALPEDDLSLASALRSPLFGWAEQDLFSIAKGRPKGRTLWQVLRNQDDKHPKTLSILRDLRKQSDFLRPYDLLERVLIRHDGRRSLLARLGAEAEDGVDSLLSQAQAYERGNVPSLTGFLSWLETEDVEVKRQLDTAGDQIRVMTVHGAKGLESPIVFLPESQTRRLIVRNELLPKGGRFLWSTKKEERSAAEQEVLAGLQAKQTEESRRLLYVAMTRAEKWLIVAAAGKTDEGDLSWHGLVADGLSALGTVSIDTDIGPVLRHELLDWTGLPLAPPSQQNAPVAAIAPLSAVPPAPRRGATLAPSDLGGDKALPGEPGAGDTEESLARGRLIHVLLEHLPNIPKPGRAAYAAALFAADPDAQRLPDCGSILVEAEAVLSDPALAHIFSPSTLAEVDVSATLAPLQGQRIHGAIDRLIVTDNVVTAIDFKSNRLVPQTPEQIPEGLLRQMGAYAAALSLIYPNHQIETVILWTLNATLMPIPPELSSTALLRSGQA